MSFVSTDPARFEDLVDNADRVRVQACGAIAWAFVGATHGRGRPRPALVQRARDPERIDAAIVGIVASSGDALVNVSTSSSLYGFIPIYNVLSFTCTTVRGTAIAIGPPPDGAPPR